MTEAKNYLLVKQLVAVKSHEEWSQVVESCSKEETNKWKAIGLQSAALKNFALVKGRRVKDVTVKEVEATPQGLEGWAVMNVSVTTAAPTTSGRNKAFPEKKAKAKAKATPAGQAPNLTESVPAAERAAKEVAAFFNSSKTYINSLVDKIKGDPPAWKWAEGFLTDYAGVEENLFNEIDQDFLREFTAAILTPSLLKDLKKKHLKGYHDRLVELVVKGKDYVLKPL